MVYDTYNYGEWMLMGFINQFKHNWGAPHCNVWDSLLICTTLQQVGRAVAGNQWKSPGQMHMTNSYPAW